MPRRSLTPKQRGELIAAFGRLCWRCGWPIWEGQPWEAGHTVPDWLDGTEVRPEHKICNRLDAPVQQRARNKSERIIAKNGLRPDYSKRDQPPAPRLRRKYNKLTKRFETVRSM